MNINLVDNIMVTLRQDRPCKEGLKRILPQRIEGGKMYSSLGVFITTVPEGIEDQEFFPADEVTGITRITDATLNRLFKPIMDFLYEYKKSTVPEEVEDTPAPSEDEDEDEIENEVEDEDTIEGDIRALIKKGIAIRIQTIIFFRFIFSPISQSRCCPDKLHFSLSLDRYKFHR